MYVLLMYGNGSPPKLGFEVGKVAAEESVSGIYEM